MTTIDSVHAGSSSPEDPRYRFVYDEAVRTIDHQEQTLDNIRARAGVLLTAASVATSFLGAAALRDSEQAGRWAVAAVCLFALVGSTCVALLWPLAKWRFRFGTSQLLKDYVEAPSPADLNEMFRDLALHLEANYGHNKKRIDIMWIVFELAAGLLFLEVIAWLAALA